MSNACSNVKLCACGADISHMRKPAKRCIACRQVVEREAKRRWSAGRGANRKRDRKAEWKLIKERTCSLAPMARLVREVGDPVPNPRQEFCLVCCGMPWARVDDRLCDGRDGYEKPVSENGICRGCGEPWGPEPAINLGSVLRSSSGMVAAHGQLFGDSVSVGRGLYERKKR